MALTIADRNLGARSDPQDIRDLRQSNYDVHDQLGQPVIIKHRWNERDLREGRAQRCPFHNDYYDEDISVDQYCFGTGYLGGYADGVLTYATIADAREDTFRLTDQGILLHDRSPQVSFPWTPIIGDDDLIITVELDDSGEILDTYDRYTLRQAQPVTVRGLGFKNTMKSLPYRVGQQAQVDTVPYGSILWDVPIVFDYNDVPTPEGETVTSVEIGVRVRGRETGSTLATEHNVHVGVAGTRTESSQGVRVTGLPGGTHVFVD
jgi:hypothetical protein